MPIDLEERLRGAFEREAGQVRPTRPEWDSMHAVPLLTTKPMAGRAPLIRWFVAAAVAVAAIAAWIVVRPDLSGREEAATFAPTGVEVPVRVVASIDPGVVVKPGSLATIRVDGHPATQVFVGADYWQGHVVQMSCVISVQDGGSCAPFVGDRPRHVSRTSTVDNRRGSANLWLWSGVPEGAAYVEYREGDVVHWQRPVAGVAAFPTVDGLGNVAAVAYTDDGVELATASWATAPRDPELDELAPIDPALYDELTQEQKNTVWAVIDLAMRSCLESLGPESWDRCLDVADTTLKNWLTERAAERTGVAPAD